MASTNPNLTPSTQKYFALSEQKDGHSELISYFNFYDKGNDCIVIHPGSHTTKVGLGSQP